MTPGTTDTPQKADCPSATCSTFDWRLKTTDGSEPLDLLEEEDGSMIYQGDNVVGVGETLLEAWNDYLYPLSPGTAPVNEEELAAMWAEYDKSNDKDLARRALDSE